MMSAISPSLVSAVLIIQATSVFKLSLSEKNILNGAKLKVLPKELPGVSTTTRVLVPGVGVVVTVEGAAGKMMDWLALRYNFSYTYVPEAVYRVEDMPGVRGQMSYLTSGDADLLLGANVPMQSRHKYMDYSLPWMETSYRIMIRFPQAATNIEAFFQPFRPFVWGLCFVSIIAALCALIFLSRMWSQIRPSRLEDDTQSGISRLALGLGNFRVAYDYVLGVILSQGGFCLDRNHAVRIAAASWCLACFVLVSAYSSTLISYVTSPIVYPLIESIYDIPKKGNVKVITDKGHTLDNTFMGATSGIYKDIGDILRKEPTLRCNVSEYAKCIERVTEGYYVYPSADIHLRNVILKDRQANGKCRFTFAKESFWTTSFVHAYPKGGPYNRLFDQGILEMVAGGFVNYWNEESSPSPRECLNWGHVKTKNQRLTLTNFSAAFGILVGGYVLSFLAFIYENSRHFLQSSSEEKKVVENI